MAAYEPGQIINKDQTDKQGQRNNIQIPKWMQKNAPIPAHIKDLKCEKIELPFNYFNGKWLVLIRNVLTEQECNDLIKFSEAQGYEEALVNIGYGRQQMIPDFRNCKRMMIDNFDMANCLWLRVKQFIPTYFNKSKKIAFNERLRFLRYHKGEFFSPHYDGTYIRPNGEYSQITFLLYLNNNFKGAKTNFLDPMDHDSKHAAKITSGMVVMFQHNIFHEGAILEEGTKYIIRTDVMYTKEYYMDIEMEKDKENIDIKYVKYNGFDNNESNEEENEEKDANQNEDEYDVADILVNGDCNDNQNEK
eukprot:185672_1